MLAPQVAADPAGEGDFVGVSTSRRVQVRTSLFPIIQSSQFSTPPGSVSRYLRALAAMYIRMTFRPVEVYEILEPLLKDYRKLRYHGMGAW